MLLDYYQDTTLDDSQKKWTLEKLKSTSYKIENTVNDISKILNHQEIKSEVTYENILLFPFFTAILADFEETIKNEKINVHLNLKNNDILFSHKEVLKEITTILLENAIKYRPAERILHITISFEENTFEKKLILQDDGDGLPLPYEKRIFKLYQRGHKNIEGNGVGLYMAKLLAYSIHANIEYLKNQSQKGATFQIIFNKNSTL